jgi:zinc finger CCHC domain-containing protein 9
MTRATNFGRKRTYVQAGFPEHEASQSTVVDTPQPESSTTALKANNLIGNEPTQDVAAAPPPKKKRKRTPKSKRDGYAAQRAAEAGITLEGKSNDGEGEVGETKIGGDGEKSTLTRVEKKQKRNLARRMKGPSSSRFSKQERLSIPSLVLAATEARRLKRIKQKNSDTVCFACREKGHAAKDCPITKKSESQGEGGAQNIVGICYR